MDRMIWLVCTGMAILLWSATSLLYKAGIHKDREPHTCFKYSVSVGTVFFIIALVFLVIRDEPFTIWESAARYWPMTVFGILYAIVVTISFNGYIYNEATVESPLEGISAGFSTVLLILAYLAFGRIDSISKLLTPLRTAGILVIVISVIALSMIRNAESRNRERANAQKPRRKQRGLGTLIFPILFAVVDGLETIISGICLDTTYGYAMPEGDSIIIVGMECAFFALCFWIYIYWKEKKIYHPFKKETC